MPFNLSRRVRHGFTLIEILIVVVILGILAAIVIPQFTDAAGEASRSNLQSQLQTIRSQIELYNVQNPADAYDAGTALGDFWSHLIENNYLQTLPKNPLQNGSTSVAGAPAAGVGWVWAESSAGDTWTLNIYSV
ncbi:MAG: prepilin-type N-terminal cleavage/methylation domain-containing protein, partial [Phycisphaerales bacterium]